MKKVMIAILVFSSISFAANLTQEQREEIMDASNYGVCNELKVRAAKGDEVILEVNCKSIIKSFELKMERKSLINRLKAVDAEIEKVNKEFTEMP